MGRRLKHYHLNMILAVGYRVRSPRGTQFRQWATAQLELSRTFRQNARVFGAAVAG